MRTFTMMNRLQRTPGFTPHRRHETFRVLSCCAVAAIVVACTGCEKVADQSWSSRSRPDIGPSASAHDWTIAANSDVAYVPDDLRQTAIEVLLWARETDAAVLRANAIEALAFAPKHLEETVQRGLVDDNRGVRFAAAMAVGRHELKNIAHMLEPLIRDDSPSVQAAAIYGLRANGLEADLNPLGQLIFSNSPEVRGNTAMVLGELGVRSSVDLMRAAASTGMSRIHPVRVRLVELQMAEAMVKLGEEEAIEAIRAALYAPTEQGEVMALACQICGTLRDEQALSRLMQIALGEGQLRQPAEVRMVAAMALAQIGLGRAPVEVPLEYIDHAEATIRAQASYTLGFMPVQAAVQALPDMLRDESGLVQVAAAGAVLRISDVTGYRSASAASAKVH